MGRDRQGWTGTCRDRQGHAGTGRGGQSAWPPSTPALGPSQDASVPTNSCHTASDTVPIAGSKDQTASFHFVPISVVFPRKTGPVFSHIGERA